ncbi:MAG: hypothetical protein HY744_01640 [Deltaproteobacteria bacterium]|nr:hypothetical protein [Deltaproteobacteria bacterium]
MRNVLLIWRRELWAYLRSPLGYAVACAVLLIDGIWFYARALGPAAGARRTSPVRDRELVLGKFLSVFTVIFAITLLSAYIPALIFVNGRVSVGHILVGYAGVLLLGAAAIAIGLFSSALAKSQVVAAIIGAALLATMVLLWLLASVTEAPIRDFLAGLALHHQRQRPFMLGVLRLENVVYYLVVTWFFLLAATKTLEARRWR